jgi:hypothetical protein
MFSRLPAEIVHKILALLIGERYLALRYVNKQLLKCITANMRDYIRDYFAIPGCRISCDEFLSLARQEVVRKMTGNTYINIYWRHMYEPLVVAVAPAHTNDTSRKNSVATLYITIGTLILIYRTDCATSEGATTVTWRAITTCSRYRPGLEFIKKYLTELHVFIKTPIVICP